MDFDYNLILEKGKHSSDLYFNLGNSYYRLNKVAESIFYFEKAKQLDPSSNKIKFNSSFAENMTIDSIEKLVCLSYIHLNNDVCGLSVKNLS